MINIIRKIGFFFFRRLNYFGYDIIKRNNFDFDDQKKILPNASVIFDVGSNRGQTIEKYSSLYSNGIIKLYSFEPISSLLESQRKKFKHINYIVYINKVLLDIPSKINFNVNHLEDTSSVLKANNDFLPKRYGEVLVQKNSVVVESVTIDQFCSKNQIEQIDILKIDVQGVELKVLKGASKMLENGAIKLIYVECLFAPFYKEQSFFEEIACFLQSKNYKLYSTYNFQFNFKTGRTLQCDSIFIHTEITAPQYNI